jgi:hypothetical protein
MKAETGSGSVWDGYWIGWCPAVQRQRRDVKSQTECMRLASCDPVIRDFELQKRAREAARALLRRSHSFVGAAPSTGCHSLKAFGAPRLQG